METLRLYFKLVGVRVRSQMQYRASFVVDTLGAGGAIFVEFVTLALVLTRFGSIGGWCFPTVVILACFRPKRRLLLGAHELVGIVVAVN